MISPVSSLAGLTYQKVLKPILFTLQADSVHESFQAIGEFSAKTPAPLIFESLFAYKNPILEQKIASISFTNPIGLSAGFDYTAALCGVTKSLGFGWHTIGTVTQEPYEGNQPPMLGRLPRSQSLWVNKGFKNPGVANIGRKLAQKEFLLPTGLSIGATNKEYPTQKEQIAEIIKAFHSAENARLNTSYYELNISCPNLTTGFDLQNPRSLRLLLSEIDELKIKKPIFIKMPIDLSDAEFLSLVEIIVQHKIHGVIIGNLTKNRSNPALFQSEVAQFSKGGFSGRPTFAPSLHLIEITRKTFGQKLIIVGTGGIFTGNDAYTKILAGANLVQLITSLIYSGPQVVGQINRDLANLLKKDGFSNISEAVGLGVQ